MQPSDFRRLDVYRRAATLWDDLRRHVEAWRSLDKWTVGVQAIRAADSIGANIAEASGRWSRLDQRRFLLVARGSARELEHWIERASERRLPLPDNSEQRVLELIRMLNGFIRAERPAT